MERLLHWKKLPVNVFIATHSPAEEADAKAATAGFDEWVAATGGAIGYRIVNSPSQGQIVVRFSPEAYLAGQEGVVGQTGIASRGKILYKAEIQIATGGLDTGGLQSVAAHEFGHALGIEGHSDSPDDLMFPSETLYLSSSGEPVVITPRPVTLRDLNTLRLCYPTLFAEASRAKKPTSAG